jgi:membrane protein YqaA with SNARE-associated domain
VSHAGEERQRAAADDAERDPPGGPGDEAAPGDPGSGPRSVHAEGSGQGEKAGPVRRLYDWMLHWAYTPHGSWALFLLSLAESSFFPIPPDPLLLALALGHPKKSLRFAAIATGASVVGGLVGYGIGAGLWHAVDDVFFQYVPGVTPEAFARVRGLYDRWDFWAVFLAGLTPIPYKVFTISAGVFDINLGIFLLASLSSRGLRFFAEAGLILRFGPSVSGFIDKYFNLLTWLFAALLVGGFVVIEFLL